MKKLTLIAGILAILLVASTGPVYKTGLVGFMNIITIMQAGIIVGFISLILAVIQIFFMRKDIAWGTYIVSVLCAVVAIAFPVNMMSKGKAVPAIHDITTDIVNPPKFDAIIALRADAPNPPEYQGQEVAKLQLEAYPDIKTQTYSQSPEAIFTATVNALESMGLEIVSANNVTGKIEASDTTPWFGFVDDVVVRIKQNDKFTILDARSKSRIGRSDLGKNAERLTLLFTTVNANLE
jgi:uncharacterized protein (DUF1499 family)